MPADAASRMSRPAPLAGRLLAILHRDAGRTDADLARLLGAGPAELSAVIGRLYRRRLVDRCAGYLVVSPAALSLRSGTSGTSGTCAGQAGSGGFRRPAEVPEPAEPSPLPEGTIMTTELPARPPHGTLRTAALDWAGRGWPVFPLRPAGKQPAFPGHTADRCTGTDPWCRSGHQGWEPRATTDPARIGRGWAATPYNVGIATGPAGLVVLDLDKPKPGEVPPPRWALPGVTDGADVLAVLCERQGQDFPAGTFTVRTRRGGLHLYFTTPPGVRLGNTNGRSGRGLGWLIDTRACGGYVVAAGSFVDQPDGTGRYEVTSDRPPAPLPGWLAGLLTTARPAPTTIGCRSAHPGQVADLGGYARTALYRECERVRTATIGGRSHTLNKAAYNLGRLIGAGALPEDVAARELAEAASVHATASPPFTAAEASAVIRCGIAAGKKRPRPITRAAA
jgi:hypothetical protein